MLLRRLGYSGQRHLSLRQTEPLPIMNKLTQPLALLK